MNRIFVVSRGTNLIVDQLWHEFYCWYSVARILLMVFCGTNLFGQPPGSRQPASQTASQPANQPTSQAAASQPASQQPASQRFL